VKPLQCDTLFTAYNGKAHTVGGERLSKVGLWKVVKKYADKAGLTDVKPHDFRRFVATQLAKKNLRQAQQALGHKRIVTTAGYMLNELESGLTNHLF
jgi:integrase/recombinase XerD